MIGVLRFVEIKTTETNEVVYSELAVTKASATVVLGRHSEAGRGVGKFYSEKKSHQVC